jgi:hypothetical protein
MEQETLEEAEKEFEKLINGKGLPTKQLLEVAEHYFIVGYETAKGISYSEEDMKLAFETGHKKGFSGYPNTENWKELPFKEWFEQFKNK